MSLCMDPPPGLKNELKEIWVRYLIDFKLLYEQYAAVKQTEELHDAMHPGEFNPFYGPRTLIEGIVAAGKEKGILPADEPAKAKAKAR